MNNRSESGAIPENPACRNGGWKRAMTPCFGARLGEKAARLHFSRTAPV